MAVLKYKDPETGEVRTVGTPPNNLTPQDIGAAPEYEYGTEDLVEGSTPLENGKLYFVYE